MMTREQDSFLARLNDSYCLRRKPAAIFFFASLLSYAVAMAAPANVNLLALGEGTLPVQASESYSQSWSPINLLDDAPSSGWCSQKGHITNNVFVFEMPNPATFTAFEFDTARTDGAKRAAKDVTVEVSSNRDTGFQKVLQASLADKKDGQHFAAAATVPGRFVRLTILNNNGDADYSELMSFRGFGEKPSASPSLQISGTYHTNYNDFHIRQQGGTFAGCYEFQKGIFEGAIEGRVVKLTWRQPGDQRMGPAVFVFAPDGKSFSGYWWYDTDKARAVDGVWTGSKISDEVGSCPHWSGSVSGQLQTELSAHGRARLYGLLFDVDSAHLRTESLQTLDDLVRLLNNEPSWKITVEGHTDSIGTEAHNQVLSVNRAAAVKEYLISKGILATRLASAGFGQSKPVADNATELGRAQNRRVELVRE